MLVPCRILHDAVKAWKGERFTVSPDGASSARVNGASSLRLLPAEDFPTLAERGTHVATIQADAVRAVVGCVLPAAARDETRPIIAGVLLELEAGGRVCATATDSYRLHHAETTGAVADEKAIVPARALKALLSILGPKTPGVVAVYRDEYEIRFVVPSSIELVTRTIEGEFPNYRQLMPDPRAEGTSVLRYDVGSFVTTLEQATPYCPDTCPARLELRDDGAVGVCASAPDLGTFNGVIPGAVYEGEGIVAAYAPLYLMDALKSAGPEMRVRDGLKPCIVGTLDDPYRRVALVMPVRLPTPIG
jgi:DNA polymerase-3 subunit beta